MITETFYLTKDNTIDLLLKADGSAVDLSSVTRMTLELDSTIIDSDISTNAFNWDTGVTGKLILDLGSESIAAGLYEKVILTVYDPDNTNGIVWAQFNLNAK